MSSAPSGLSRRRAGGAASPGVNGSNVVPTSGLNESGPSTPSGSNNHKIAFDARDLESEEELVMPKLTLMEEVLLLGLKDKQVSSNEVVERAEFILTG